MKDSKRALITIEDNRENLIKSGLIDEETLSICEKALKKEVGYDLQQKGTICCEECNYETKIATYEECLVEVSNDGGYLKSDKFGGCVTECPSCERDTLVWND